MRFRGRLQTYGVKKNMFSEYASLTRETPSPKRSYAKLVGAFLGGMLVAGTLFVMVFQGASKVDLSTVEDIEAANYGPCGFYASAVPDYAPGKSSCDGTTFEEGACDQIPKTKLCCKCNKEKMCDTYKTKQDCKDTKVPMMNKSFCWWDDVENKCKGRSIKFKECAVDTSSKYFHTSCMDNLS